MKMLIYNIITLVFLVFAGCGGTQKIKENKNLVSGNKIESINLPSDDTTENENLASDHKTENKKLLSDNTIENKDEKVLGNKNKEINDLFLHNNPPKYYDAGLTTITYKFFQIIRDENNYNYKAIKFWDEDKKKYGKEISLLEVNPYKRIFKHKIINGNGMVSDKFDLINGEIEFDMSHDPERNRYISKNYPPEYTGDNVVKSANISFMHEDLFYNFKKNNIAIAFTLEVNNKTDQFLGAQSTVFIFDSTGNITDTIVFDTPVYYLNTDANGRYLGFAIGGFYGENLEIVYPETFRLYDIKKKRFIFFNNDFIGLYQGGGNISNYFYFYFDIGKKKMKMIVIDTKHKKLMEHIFSRDALYNNLTLTPQGFIDRNTGKIKYSFEKDFTTKKVNYE